MGLGDLFSSSFPPRLQYVVAPPGSEWWCVVRFPIFASGPSPRITISEMARNGAGCGHFGGSLASAAGCYDDWYGNYAWLIDFLRSTGGSYTQPSNLGDRAFAVHLVRTGVNFWQVFVQRGSPVFR